MIMRNMRTLGTQVRLRRLIKAYSDGLDRLLVWPADRGVTTTVVSRLQELAAGVQEAWARESADGHPEAAYANYVEQALRMAELAIVGLGQEGADLRLLQRDFEEAALPLEVFLRGLDVAPALQRSA
jgi:hypothetical protein